MRHKFTLVNLITTTLGFYILMLTAFLSDLLYRRAVNKEPNRDGYPLLRGGYLFYYHRYVVRRCRGYFSLVVCSLPGAEFMIKDLYSDDYGWTLKDKGTQSKYLNFASYNYLGFARNDEASTKTVKDAIEKYGFTTASSRKHFGTCDLHLELEKQMAEFLGVEDVITFGMGFATNVQNLPIILSQGCLVISDSKNHASLILGIQMSGATVKKIKHNDVDDLERHLKEAIVFGQVDNNNIPWKKILIVVEGIYSMEGTIVRLPEIIALKKKYKAYLYLDEAHSIGALGKTGRGVVEYFGCDPRDVDIFMGTFTKSFTGVGGYIGGKRKVISMLRRYSFASKYASAMSPPVTAHIIYILNSLMGRDGTNIASQRLDALSKNTKYFRRRLKKVGVVVYGHDDSPVVPFLTYSHTKTCVTVQKLLEKKIATVGVAYPAAPMMEARIRICLQAQHTKEHLDYLLQQITEIADELGLKYADKSTKLCKGHINNNSS